MLTREVEKSLSYEAGHGVARLVFLFVFLVCFVRNKSMLPIWTRQQESDRVKSSGKGVVMLLKSKAFSHFLWRRFMAFVNLYGLLVMRLLW